MFDGLQAFKNVYKLIAIKKPLRNLFLKGWVLLYAVWTGLEPATSCVTGRHSNQTELPDRNTGFADAKLKHIFRFQSIWCIFFIIGLLLHKTNCLIMPGKSKANKKIPQKPARKSFRIRNLFYIIIAVVVVTAFLLANFYNPRKSKPVQKQQVSSPAHTPSFRHDGSLWILRNQNESIKLDIEIADSEKERTQGLMYRHHLPEMAGMLFIFDRDEHRSFWMKNTFISLDIIYIHSSGEIVSIQKYTQPGSTYSVPSEKPSKYVLEVNAGFSDKYGIKPGDKIEYSFL